MILQNLVIPSPNLHLQERSRIKSWTKNKGINKTKVRNPTIIILAVFDWRKDFSSGIAFSEFSMILIVLN